MNEHQLTIVILSSGFIQTFQNFFIEACVRCYRMSQKPNFREEQFYYLQLVIVVVLGQHKENGALLLFINKN